jgi:hypothetical protein
VRREVKIGHLGDAPELIAEYSDSWILKEVLGGRRTRKEIG